MSRIFINADHGMAVIYFLQSDLLSTLLDAGVEVVLLTDGALRERIREKFGRPGLIVEDMRLEQAKAYFQREKYQTQWWLDYLRRAGASKRINLEAVNSYIQQVGAEATGRRRQAYPLMKGAARVLQNSRAARRMLLRAQMRFTPAIYADLFERYRPDLVIASTYGWRYDRYLLREAHAHGIPTMAAIVGWDNPSSYGLPAAPIDWATCWSEIQKQELVLGGDWQPEQVNVGGVPAYDGYIRREWLMPREAYFRLHNLDPERKLITHACSFVSFSPNIQNVEALARLVAEDALSERRNCSSACTPTIS